MNRQGKSPTRNKRRNRFNRKKKQEARNDENNANEVQDRKEAEVTQHDQLTTRQHPQQVVQVEQKNDKQQVNLQQPTKQDYSQDEGKAREKERSDPLSLKEENLNLGNESTRTGLTVQELKQRVSHQMKEMEDFVVIQLKEFNKTHKCFDTRAFLSGLELSKEERDREIAKAVQAVTEYGKKKGAKERKMPQACFQYDELRQVLQRLEAIENEAEHHGGKKDINGKALATQGKNKQESGSNEKGNNTLLPGRGDGQNGNLQSWVPCASTIIEQASYPNSKQTKEQHFTPNNLKKTRKNSSERCFGGSHPGVMNIERETGDENVRLSSSPLEEDQKSETSHQPLSSDDSNESLAFQAFAAPMKFLRRVKKKVGNFLFSTKKEKARDTDDDGVSNVSCDNIDVEARGGNSPGANGACLSQPVQRAFLEFQNDTAQGKASNRRGLEEILVTPESPAVLCTQTPTVKGRDAKHTGKGSPTRLVTQGAGPKEVKNGKVGQNVANKNVSKKEALSSRETPIPNGTESGKNKVAAEIHDAGPGGSPQRATAKKGDGIKSLAATQKQVPVVSPSGGLLDKQKSDVEKQASPSKGTSPAPTTPQHGNIQHTPSANVPGNVNKPAANGSNPTPKGSPKSASVARKNIQVQQQSAIASSTSQKKAPEKTSIVPVGTSASTAAASVASGGKVSNKNQTHLQLQQVPQKEQRKQAILKSPAQGVVTKGTFSAEEKKANSPDKLQDRNDTRVVAANKASPVSNLGQQGTPKDTSNVSHKQENCATGSKSPTTKKEKPSPSKAPQIAVSLPSGKKRSPATENQTTIATVHQVKSGANSKRMSKQENARPSSPYERRILKARRKIVFDENKNPEASGAAGLSDTGEVDYETVMPEDFEQAVAEAMEDEKCSGQTKEKPKPATPRPQITRAIGPSPLQDIPESSPLQINAEGQETPSPARRKKYRGKYATGFTNPRKSINCCCEHVCDYCVPSWEWDKVVANQRKKR